MQFIKKNRYINTFFLFTTFITLFGIYFIINFNTYVKKGIDLVGGSYVVLNVIMNSVYDDILIEAKKRIESDLEIKAEKIILLDSILFLSYSDQDSLKKTLSEIKKLNLELIITEKENQISLSIPEEIKEIMTENAININIQALRKRLDPFGAGELLIARQKNNIILEIPNIYDKDQIKRLIGSTANLQMKVVIDSANSKEKLENKYDDMLDYITISKNKEGTIFYVLSKESPITGALLKKAHVGYNPERGNEPIVSIEFNSIGAKKFREMTEKNLNKQIAIVIDNEVITAPMVGVVIPDGKAFIQGKFSITQAQELVLLLESGSFAAPVFYAQERVIAPLLGEQTIKQGLFACLIGLILLFIFTVLYYRASGLLAFLVLLYNLLFTLIGMYFIGATLTLSGIAGLVLTLGMAIDSSILLFERIKDELKHGKTFKDAFTIAFSDGLTVILDANITHFLVAVVLYYIGAGPLKGFATSMLIGIISTLFTGIILLKGFLKYSINILKYEKLSI
jgi:protein-export membrane protein SecD